MKKILLGIVLLACTAQARAQCNREIRKPQKPRQVARLDWHAVGRMWQVALIWETYSVDDDGSEEAGVTLAVRDNLKRPILGDLRDFDLTPNRCDKRIEPSLSTVKLMGRDFLLVTLPTSQWGQGGSGIVVARMYSIDEKGHLTDVFRSAYRGEFTRGPTCRHLLRSYIQPVNEDGSRIAWIYEAPGVEWARKKSECATTKPRRTEFTWAWKNGCFAVEEQPDPNDDRLTSKWDDHVCVSGIGRIDKKARPDGGAPPDAGGTGTRGDDPWQPREAPPSEK